MPRGGRMIKATRILCGVQLAGVMLLLPGCGRYGDPLPPQYFSPKAVGQLEVTADLRGVNFKWNAPSASQNGKELKSMNGYYVERKEILRRADIVDARVPYERLDELEDTHVEVLKDMREEARKAGQVGRKVKVDQSLVKFGYSDTTVQPGHTYTYRIVPFNQGGVEGEVLKIVKVVFRGQSSEISLLDQPAVGGDLGQADRVHGNRGSF
jgi:hypothetical protein